MDNFLTWDILLTYGGFIATVYMVVEFTKELKIIKKIRTRWWSFYVTFFLLCATNLAMQTFNYKDILLYVLNSMTISLGSNGLSNINKEKR